MIQKISFMAAVNTPTASISTENRHPNKNKNSNSNGKAVIVAGLSGLAVAGITALALHRIKLKNAEKEIKEELEPYEKDIKDYIEYAKNYIDENGISIKSNNLAVDFEPTLKKYTENLNSKEEWRLLITMLNPNIISEKIYPSVIETGGLQTESAKNLVEILATKLHLPYESRIFSSASIDRFFEILYRESKNSADRDIAPAKLIYIENLKQMFTDIENSPTDKKEKYKQILKIMNNNNIIMVSEDTGKISDITKVTLNFKPEINETENIKPVFKQFDEIENILNELSTNGDRIMGANKLLLKLHENPKIIPIIIAENLTEENYQTIINCIDKNINKTTYKIFNTKEVENLKKDDFIKAFEEIKAEADLTGGRPYLRIKDSENLISNKELIDLIKQADVQYGVNIILDCKNDLLLTPIFADSEISILRNFKNIKDINDKESIDMLLQKQIICENFFNFLEAEKSGSQITIENGIIISGTNKDSADLLEWIKSVSKLNFQQVDFDINNPKKSFREVVSLMENAKLIKKEGGERTLLYIKDLDQALCRFDTAEDRRVLGLFKNIIENCAAETNTTIITTTTKDFSCFEDASISGHRFGIKINFTLKETK